MKFLQKETTTMNPTTSLSKARLKMLRRALHAVNQSQKYPLTYGSFDLVTQKYGGPACSAMAGSLVNGATIVATCCDATNTAGCVEFALQEVLQWPKGNPLSSQDVTYVLKGDTRYPVSGIYTYDDLTTMVLNGKEQRFLASLRASDAGNNAESSAEVANVLAALAGALAVVQLQDDPCLLTEYFKLYGRLFASYTSNQTAARKELARSQQAMFLALASEQQFALNLLAGTLSK